MSDGVRERGRMGEIVILCPLFSALSHSLSLSFLLQFIMGLRLRLEGL